jgi:hypothetical protein
VFKKLDLKKLGAIVLLAVFTLNSVPKIFIHEIFSNHSHKGIVKHSCSDEDAPSISKNYHCACEKYFTETLFQASVVQFQFVQNTYLSQHISPSTEINTQKIEFRQLRGPPSRA